MVQQARGLSVDGGANGGLQAAQHEHKKMLNLCFQTPYHNTDLFCSDGYTVTVSGHALDDYHSLRRACYHTQRVSSSKPIKIHMKSPSLTRVALLIHYYDTTMWLVWCARVCAQACDGQHNKLNTSVLLLVIRLHSGLQLCSRRRLGGRDCNFYTLTFCLP